MDELTVNDIRLLKKALLKYGISSPESFETLGVQALHYIRMLLRRITEKGSMQKNGNNNSTFLPKQLETDFSRTLGTLRLKKEMKLRTLADKVGLLRSKVSEMELGFSPPPNKEIVIKMADVLGIPQDRLVKEAKEAHNKWTALLNS